MADKKNKKAPATFGSIALQNYAAQRGYEVGQDASLGETLKPAVELLGNYAENAIAERAKFIDNLPEDYEVELLPVDSREAFTNFASDAKQRYSDAAGVAAKYSANPNSEQYREAVKRMENIKKGLSTNFDDYNKLADIRKKYTNNHGNEVALTDEQEVMYTDIIAGKNFESTPNGLVYNRKDLDGNTVEQVPINDLPTIDYIDPELGSNMVTNVLDNPYNGGVKGSDMQTTLSNANVQIQNLTSNPAKLKQAIFNGFGGEKTKFINYYVGENLIDQKNATFLDGINDINGDNLITKDDMQDGVWSFKDGEAGNAARTLFERTIKDHKNDPDFINNKELNVRQKLNSFMSDIAKDKYLEGQANKFKNTVYNIKGIGSRNHDQIQGDFDKLNNHEPITTYGGAELTPVEGKPGLYFTLSEDGKTRTEVTRDTLEKALDIFSVRGDFNTDPVKATTATDSGTTTGSETTTDTEETVDAGDGASGATIKVDPPEVIEYEKDDKGVPLLPKKEDAKEGSFYVNKQKGTADYGKGYKFENGNYTHVETVTFDKNGGIASRTPVAKEGKFRGEVDYTNQPKNKKPNSRDIWSLKADLDFIQEQAMSGGWRTFHNPKLRDELEEQIRLSDAYIKRIDDVYIGTGIIKENGVMKAGIPFLDADTFGGRGDIHRNYNSEKKRNQRLREKYENLPESVGSKEPVATTEVAKEGEFISDVDYTNQTKEAPIPRSSEIKALKATLKDIKKQANSNGLTTLRDPKLREDIEEQIRLSDSYIKAVDDAYMNTGIINEEGVMRGGIPFISNVSFGGRGDLHENYNFEKKRNKRLKEKYANLPEPVGSIEPAEDKVKSEENIFQNIPSKPVEEVKTNLDPSINTVDAGEVELKDTNLDVPVGSKEAVTKIADLLELDQKKLNIIQKKEGWESEGYIPTIGSGITVGYGIDLSQAPYNTAKGLKENGFSQEFIDLAVEQGVLGKTWKELKKEGKDVGERSTKDGVKTTFIKNNGGTDFLKQFQIPNTEQEKIRIYSLTSKNTEKQTSLFEDVMSEDVLLDYFTIVHWGGGGLSDKKYDKLYNGGAFGADGKTGKISSPSNRKAFVVTTLNRKLQKIKEEKGNISNEDYTQALEEARDSVPNFVADSPGNTKTINNSIRDISKSKETQA